LSNRSGANIDRGRERKIFEVESMWKKFPC
jgi:hypothetical protein